MRPDLLLALISDLYEQAVVLRQKVDELEQQLAQAPAEPDAD